MRRQFHTIADLAQQLADELNLDLTAVRAAIPRTAFGRYEDITDAQYETVCVAVYESVTGNTYPAEWAAHD